jgi:hypothetical protein
MSRSPRKNLRMASAELDDLVAVIERHPAARAELVADIGEELLVEILAARETIARAVKRLDPPASRGVSAT